jgi:predicted O-methyltransferase YrrM
MSLRFSGLSISAFGRWLASFVARQPVVRRSSEHHPHLEVAVVKGRKVLDGAMVNYSFGGLHEVFREAFERLEVGKRDIKSVLLIGLGAGSVVHLLRRDFGVRAPITAVEIDPVMVDVAREHFDLDGWRNLEVVVADAAEWIARATRRFDLVVIDAFYEAQVPASLRTAEFARDLRERIAPGGWLLFNQVSNRPAARTDALACAELFQKVLGSVRLLQVRGNCLLHWERPVAESVVADPAERR